MCVVHAMACEWSGCRRRCVLACACDVVVDAMGHAGLYIGPQAILGNLLSRSVYSTVAFGVGVSRCTHLHHHDLHDTVVVLHLKSSVWCNCGPTSRT